MCHLALAASPGTGDSYYALASAAWAGGETPLALAMALTGCVSLREAYAALDLRTLVLVAGMIGFGLTAEQTGVMAWLS